MTDGTETNVSLGDVFLCFSQVLLILLLV